MRQQPTTTVIVPRREYLDALIGLLLDKSEIFTVEPSQTQPGVWHVGLLPGGVALVTEALGPAHYVGTVDDLPVGLLPDGVPLVTDPRRRHRR